MKMKVLEGYLGTLDGFRKPKVLLEQYSTQPHIAARILYTMYNHYHDIQDKFVADLGCGNGIFTIGASLLGAGACVAFDVDEDALDICRCNCDKMDLANVETVLINVEQLKLQEFHHRLVDVVITNPPFGTKNSEGIDMVFVQAGLAMADTVYSLHKTTTRKHIEKKALEWKVEMEVVAELRFDLPATYKFHKRKSQDVAVDFIRFSHKI